LLAPPSKPSRLARLTALSRAALRRFAPLWVRFAQKGEAGHGLSGWVRNGSPTANEMVLWTISSDERREPKRAAGPPGEMPGSRQTNKTAA